MVTTQQLTTQDLAEELETTPKVLRRFLRSEEQTVLEPVGKGHRYLITTGQVKKLQRQFAAWRNEHQRVAA